MSGDIDINRDGAVQVLRFARPEKKNAITTAMYEALAAALAAADADDGLAVSVFLGMPGAFTAGHDIADFMRAATAGEGLGDSVLGFIRALASADKPLVAGVDGLAVGIGTTLLMHCDHVVASPRTLFRTPFVDLGLVPEAASSLIAPRLMGHPRAFELLVMGRDMDAAAALGAGLVNAIAEPVRVEELALAAARTLAEKPRRAMLAAHRLLKGDRDAILARIDAEAAHFADHVASPEAQAAFAAFISRKG